MMIIAEYDKHAERKARWSSDDFKKSCRNCSRENKFRPRKTVLIANTGG